MKNVLFILVLCLLGITPAYGQINCLSPEIGDSCHQSPFLCGNYLNDFCGRNFGLSDDSLSGQLFAKAGFMRFAPCKDTVALEVSVYNCVTNTVGLAFGLYAGNCLDSAILYYADLLLDETDTLLFTNLQPDSIYSLIVSGIGGAECEFSIQVLEGIGTADPDSLLYDCADGFIDGPSVLCPGDIGTYTVVLPNCTVTGTQSSGGNGYACPPVEACPSPDSLVWKWHIPANTYFIGDSTSLSVQIGIDSAFFELDTLVMDSIWISWALIPSGAAPDPLLFCDCGGAGVGIIEAKQVTFMHNIEYQSCFLTCAMPECEVNGVVYTLPGEYVIDIDNCNRLVVVVEGDLEAPTYSDPVATCTPNNNAFTVTFTISGMQPFQVDGVPLSDSTYVSALISNGTQYSFTIEQANGCQTVLSGTYDCTEFCTNDAGLLASETMGTCMSDTASLAVTSLTDPVLSPNDVVAYWLFDGSGNVLEQQTTMNFTFNPALIQAGETYFVRRVIGQPDINGQPDLEHGCTHFSSAQAILFYALPELSIGEDMLINLGKQIDLHAESDSIPASVVWTASNGWSQDGGLDWTINPEENMMVNCAIVDSNGCEAQDNVQILVELQEGIYRPNTLMIGADQPENQYFTIYSADGWIQQITSLAIFDRWGAMVYKNQDFPANVPNAGWDGHVRGKAGKPGVYIYMAEIQLLNGDKPSFTGTVTLLR